MKRTFYKKVKNSPVNGLLILLMVMSIGAVSHVQSQTSRCEFNFSGCMTDFNGDTIIVSDDIVALTARVKSCAPTNTKSDTTKPPALVFIIDNSGSMSTATNPTDQTGSRFRVSRDLVDSVYKVYPKAEVGIVVFITRLYFDTVTTSTHNEQTYYYKRFFTPLANASSTKSQAFVKLIRLDSTYSTAAGNKRGLDIIKDVLLTKDRISNGTTYQDLVYDPGLGNGGTNITDAFLGAKQAMKATMTGKERQFFIFLSDGASNAPEGRINDFVKGDSTPTTFTVFFTKDSNPPDLLVQMTNNIKTNGYTDSMNLLSNIWAMQAGYNALMNLMMKNIMNTVLSISYGKPNKLAVNATSSTNASDSLFIFQNQYPLSSTYTLLNFVLNYSYYDSTRMKNIDTVQTTKITIKRQPGATTPNGLIKDCWGSPTLEFYYNGAPITGPIYETMANVEIRFTSGWKALSGVKVSLFTSASKDSEMVDLLKNSTFWASTFQRVISGATRGDRIIQNAQTDSIIAIYRNPILPLDTIRIAKPFRISKAIRAQNASIFDVNADGYCDSIFIAMSSGFDPLDSAYVINKIKLNTGLGLTITKVTLTSAGMGIRVNASNRSTAVVSTDKIDFLGFSDPLPHGGLIIDTTLSIIDKAAPVILRARIGSDGRVGDTIFVTFTEKTGESFTNEPFKFLDTAKVGYSLFVSASSCTDSCLFVIQSISDGKLNINRGDSMWINVSGSVIDLFANTQSNPANRKVMLTVELKPYTVKIMAGNNPFSASSVTPPPFVQDVIDKIKKVDPNVSVPSNGIALRVLPDSAKTDPVTLKNIVQLEGYVSIYDVVQNIILKRTKFTFVKDSKELLYVWDFRNTQGRLVADGTYYAVIEVTGDLGYKTRQIKALGKKP